MNRIPNLILILFFIASCSKHQNHPSDPSSPSNPADSNTILTVTVDSSVGVVTTNASTDTFWIQLKDPSIIKVVPVVLHFAVGATPSEGKQLTDSTWSDTVDISQNQIHPITITSRNGKTAKYGVGFSYMITNFAFPGMQSVYAVVPHGDTLYAGNVDGLAISSDGGINFTKTISVPSASTSVTSIAIQNTTVYAGTSGGGLIISPDGGQTFQVYQFSGTNNWVTAVFAQGDTVYAGTLLTGLYISHDRGQSFSSAGMSSGVSSSEVTGIYAQGSMVYVGTRTGIFISYDGGVTFMSTNFANIHFAETGNSSCDGLTVYNGVIYAAADGLYVSKDNGVTFTVMISPLNAVQAVSVEGNMICAAAGEGVMVSTDGGATFANYAYSSGLVGFSADAVAIQGGTIYSGFVAGAGGVSVMAPR